MILCAGESVTEVFQSSFLKVVGVSCYDQVLD